MVPIISNKKRKEKEVQNNTKVKEKVANGKELKNSIKTRPYAICVLYH